MGSRVCREGTFDHLADHEVDVGRLCDPDDRERSQQARLAEFYVEDVRGLCPDQSDSVCGIEQCLVSTDRDIHALARGRQSRDIARRDWLFDEVETDAMILHPLCEPDRFFGRPALVGIDFESGVGCGFPYSVDPFDILRNIVSGLDFQLGEPFLDSSFGSLSCDGRRHDRDGQVGFNWGRSPAGELRHRDVQLTAVGVDSGRLDGQKRRNHAGKRLSHDCDGLAIIGQRPTDEMITRLICNLDSAGLRLAGNRWQWSTLAPPSHAVLGGYGHEKVLGLMHGPK